MQLVRAERRAQHRIGDQPSAFLDHVAVPPGPVLLGQRDQTALGVGAGCAAGIGQQHRCEQAGDLAIVG
jgi:hypothetical protein